LYNVLFPERLVAFDKFKIFLKVYRDLNSFGI